MGYFDKSPGDTLTAANVDTLMLQSIMRFADSSARDTALSGVLAEGLHTYQDDANTVTVYTGAAWEIVHEPPQSWSPTITQSLTVTGTVGRGWYQRSRGVFHAHLTWTATGSGTATNAIIITTPLTLANLEDIHGSISFRDTSGSIWRVGSVIADTTSQFRFVIDSGTAEYGVAAGDGITNGDVLRVDLHGRY